MDNGFADFNSLAPRGANPGNLLPQVFDSPFQLTRLARGEPRSRTTCRKRWYISTHSPRAGRTVIDARSSYEQNNFNSLAPRGANLCLRPRRKSSLTFQLTRPARGEPAFSEESDIRLKFQLTRPARGEPPYLAIGLLAHHYLGRTFTFRLILSSVFFRFFPRTSRDFRVVCGSHDQNMIKPSLSYPAFAPICSTFFFQSFPR